MAALPAAVQHGFTPPCREEFSASAGGNLRMGPQWACLMGTSINSEPPNGTAMKTITYGAIIDHLWY
jgi:hypothetical protein